MRFTRIGWLLLPGMFLAPIQGLPQERPTVLISDTHMGLGTRADGSWHPQEDFRWSNALEGFLDHLAATYPDHDVDVVVLGDFLELWQRPAHLPCTTPEADQGCTKDEMVAIADAVVLAHGDDLAALAGYVAKGTNRLHIVPGNHDAAVLLPEVRETLLAAFPGPARERVQVEADGMWTSPDGSIVTEHGHQIGADVNRYDDWPQVATTSDAGVTRLIRPWGENFVQALFNAEESTYPLIDNLGPESAGLRYRFADKGLVRSAADLARFLAFNLFETSYRQKLEILAAPDGTDEDLETRWDTVTARTLGYRLMLQGLGADDPLAERIIAPTEEGAGLRAELDALVLAMSVPELIQLCDHAAIQGRVACKVPVMGASVERLVTTNEAVLRKHLDDRVQQHRDMRFYVYGHTHKYQAPWDLQLSSGRTIRVANTGAFQRVIDEAGFEKRRIARNLDHSEALRGVTLDDLPACYTFIAIGGDRRMRIHRWYQKETDADGKRVSVLDSRCK